MGAGDENPLSPSAPEGKPQDGKYLSPESLRIWLHKQHVAERIAASVRRTLLGQSGVFLGEPNVSSWCFVFWLKLSIIWHVKAKEGEAIYYANLYSNCFFFRSELGKVMYLVQMSSGI